MASSLSYWEVDPFFSAAEEVQNSTDRMESLYRLWKYTEGVAQTSPEDTSVIAAVETNKRDLVTALDTVRWQLEEFARAVEVARTAEQVYLGEDAEARHSQFIRAIRSQISNIESQLGDLYSQNKLKYANKDEEDSRTLASFLSGSIEDDDVEEEIASVAIDVDCHVNGFSPQVNGFTHANGHVNGYVNGFTHVNGQDLKHVNGHVKDSKHVNGDAERQIRAYDDVGGHVNGFHKVESSSHTENGRHVWDLWGFWRGRKSVLQTSKSMFKRWKDGDAGILDSAEECFSAIRNGLTSDLEQGRSNRRVNSPGKTGRGQQSIAYGNYIKITVWALIIICFIWFYFWLLSKFVPSDREPVTGSFDN